VQHTSLGIVRRRELPLVAGEAGELFWKRRGRGTYRQLPKASSGALDVKHRLRTCTKFNPFSQLNSEVQFAMHVNVSAWPKIYTSCRA
jgi:hypothetical protein